MRAKLLLGLVTTVALVVTLLGIPAAASETTASAEPAAKRAQKAWKPPTGGFFNDPWGNREAKFRIERQIVEAIRHAHKGSYIRIAVYSFDRVNVAKALINAHKRGVRVQVLHNDHQYTKAMKMLKKRLGTNRAKKSWDYTCKTGCRSFQGVLHDKIFLFEHTGGARNVVMTGSANLTKNSTIHQFNDLLVQRGTPRLYDRLLKLFRELRRDKPAKPLYQRDGFGPYRLWVLPRPKLTRKNDPIMNALSPVRCKGAAGGTGINGRTKIRVSMHAWNGDRGVWIAKRLRSLFAQGCNVKVMWALAGARVKDALAVKTKRGVIRRHANGYNTDCDPLRQVDMYSHQKYMTISGHYGKDRSTSLVFTGSSNWTPSGVSGDEMILRVQSKRLVNRWNKNFEFIWTKRSRPVGRPGGFQPAPPSCLLLKSSTERRMTTQGLNFSGPHWEAD